MPHTQKPIRDSKQVSSASVFGFGVCAGGVVTLFTAVLRGLRIFHFNTEMFVGSAVTGRTDSSTWWLGFAVYLVLSGLAAFAYAMIFRSAHRSGAAVGMNLSIYHWLVSGAAIGFAALVHPLVPASISAPGFFMASMGLGAALVFFIGHLIFGAVVGALFDLAAMRRDYPRPLASSGHLELRPNR